METTTTLRSAGPPRAARANRGDNGSSRARPPSTVSPLQGLREALPRVRIKTASEWNDGTADTAIVVVGSDQHDEGESVATPGGDVGVLIHAVAAANPHIVVVLIGGSAILTEEWLDHVPALVLAWYGGMEGGRTRSRWV